MARLVIIMNAGSMTWSPSANSVSVANWPITLTTVAFGTDTSRMSSYALTGTAKTPAVTTVTFTKVIGSTTYYASAVGSMTLSFEDIVTSDNIEATLSTILTKVTGIEADVDNIDTKTAVLTDVTNGNVAIKTLLNAINAYVDKIDDGTDGLSAIKTMLSTVNTNVASIKTTAEGINSDVDSATYGLSAIKAALAILTDGTNGLAAIKTAAAASKTASEANKATLESTIYGLSKLATLITTVDDVVDLLTTSLDEVNTAVVLNGAKLDSIQSMVDDTGYIQSVLTKVQSRLAVVRFKLDGGVFAD